MHYNSMDKNERPNIGDTVTFVKHNKDNEVIGKLDNVEITYFYDDDVGFMIGETKFYLSEMSDWDYHSQETTYDLPSVEEPGFYVSLKSHQLMKVGTHLPTLFKEETNYITTSIPGVAFAINDHRGINNFVKTYAPWQPLSRDNEYQGEYSLPGVVDEDIENVLHPDSRISLRFNESFINDVMVSYVKLSGKLCLAVLLGSEFTPISRFVDWEYEVLSQGFPIPDLTKNGYYISYHNDFIGVSVKNGEPTVLSSDGEEFTKNSLMPFLKTKSPWYPAK